MLLVNNEKGLLFFLIVSYSVSNGHLIQNESYIKPLHNHKIILENIENILNKYFYNKKSLSLFHIEDSHKWSINQNYLSSLFKNISVCHYNYVNQNLVNEITVMTSDKLFQPSQPTGYLSLTSNKIDYWEI